MKKYGFTLAEVLITLGLIGVVAALTMPGLTANAQKAQVGPALAKVVSVLENANRLILADNNAGSLDEVCQRNYFNCIQNYVPGQKDEEDATKYTSYNLSSDMLTTGQDYPMYKTSDGMAIIFYDYFSDVNSGDNLSNKYGYDAYEIFVDTNGPSKRPNALGRDTFKFYVDTYGKVIPVGGRADAEYTLPSGVAAGGYASWKDGDCDASGVSGSGDNCAGSIADNGWKVIY